MLFSLLHRYSLYLLYWYKRTNTDATSLLLDAHEASLPLMPA
jgi:hypothetical protein